MPGLSRGASANTGPYSAEKNQNSFVANKIHSLKAVWYSCYPNSIVLHVLTSLHLTRLAQSRPMMSFPPVNEV